MRCAARKAFLQSSLAVLPMLLKVSTHQDIVTKSLGETSEELESRY